MSDDDPIEQNTTDLLLACAGTAMAMADVTGKVPARAVLIFEVLDPEGHGEIQYVATRGMAVTDVIGFGHFLREVATSTLFDCEHE